MKRRIVVFLFILLSISPIALADSVTEPEKPILNEMLRGFDALLLMADNAEFSRNADLRFPLNYDILREDIRSIRDGLKRHMENPSRSPRKLDEIQADY